MSKKRDDNRGNIDPSEDLRPSPSYFYSKWLDGDEGMQWDMEIRERLNDRATIRLGKISLKGRFDGTLTLSIPDLQSWVPGYLRGEKP